MKTVDVGVVLDEGRWSGYQKLLIVGTALTIILDGIDNLTFAVTMVIVFVSLALVRRHIERTPSDLAAVKAGAYSR